MVLTKVNKLPLLYRNLAIPPTKSAGILVIGDEILKGEVVDTNSPHATKKLYNMGIKVKKICVVGDDVDEISKEIEAFSKSYNFVVTTGGIGPTHDDVTFEGVAKAFGVPLMLDNQLKKLCEKFYKTTDVNHPGMKLAKIPKTAKLTYHDEAHYPNVSIENVFIFPGIPELFTKSFNGLSDKLFKCENKFYSGEIYITLTEDKIAEELSRIIVDFPQVQIGSYPKLYHESYKVKITLESTDEKIMHQAFDTLLSRLPKDAVVYTNR